MYTLEGINKLGETETRVFNRSKSLSIQETADMLALQFGLSSYSWGWV